MIGAANLTSLLPFRQSHDTTNESPLPLQPIDLAP